MKKTIITMLALGGIALGADTYYTGDNEGWWEAASNWSGGDVPSINNHAYIGYNTDGTVASPITVKLGNNAGDHTMYGYTISIAEGSVFNVTTATSDYKPWGTTFNIYGSNGLTIDASMWGDYKNGASAVGLTPAVFNLNEKGSVLVSGVYTRSAAAHYTFNATVDTYADALAVEKRTLMIFTASGADEYEFQVNVDSYIGGALTTVDGNALTRNQSADFSVLTDDMIGTYKLSYEQIEGTDNYGIVASYVVGQTIPEPTTATLSLLALAGLAARRRRR